MNCLGRMGQVITLSNLLFYYPRSNYAMGTVNKFILVSFSNDVTSMIFISPFSNVANFSKCSVYSSLSVPILIDKPNRKSELYKFSSR